MAIAAKRFKMLDNETNVPVSDFRALIGNSILNTLTGSIFQLSEELAALLNAFLNGGLLEEIEKWLDKLLDFLGLDDLINLLSSFGIDLNSFMDLFDKLFDMFDNADELLGLFRQLSDEDKLRLLIELLRMRSNAFEQIMLNKKNNTYSTYIKGFGGTTAVSDKERLLAALMTAFGRDAYRRGYMGFMGVIMGHITDAGLLGQIALALLKDAISRGDLTSILDIADSDAGEHVKLTGAHLSKSIWQYVTIGDLSNTSDLVSIYDDLDRALKRVDGEYTTSIHELYRDPVSGGFYDLSSIRNRGVSIDITTNGITTLINGSIANYWSLSRDGYRLLEAKVASLVATDAPSASNFQHTFAALKARNRPTTAERLITQQYSYI